MLIYEKQTVNLHWYSSIRCGAVDICCRTFVDLINCSPSVAEIFVRNYYLIKAASELEIIMWVLLKMGVSRLCIPAGVDKVFIISQVVRVGRLPVMEYFAELWSGFAVELSIRCKTHIIMLLEVTLRLDILLLTQCVSGEQRFKKDAC